MIRARFHVNKKSCGNDYRPVEWPIKYPYWCTGENSEDYILVAYADNTEDIYKLWPEANLVEAKAASEIFFSNRFPKPDWYKQ